YLVGKNLSLKRIGQPDPEGGRPVTNGDSLIGIGVKGVEMYSESSRQTNGRKMGQLQSRSQGDPARYPVILFEYFSFITAGTGILYSPGEKDVKSRPGFQ